MEVFGVGGVWGLKMEERWSEEEGERSERELQNWGWIDEGVRRKYWNFIKVGGWRLGLWLVVVTCGGWLATFSHKGGSKMALHKRGRVAKFWPLMLGFLVCNLTNSVLAV